MNLEVNRLILVVIKLSLLLLFLHYLLHSYEINNELHTTRKLLRHGQSNDTFCKTNRNLLFDMKEVKHRKKPLLNGNAFNHFFLRMNLQDTL